MIAGWVVHRRCFSKVDVVPQAAVFEGQPLVHDHDTLCLLRLRLKSSVKLGIVVGGPHRLIR